MNITQIVASNLTKMVSERQPFDTHFNLTTALRLLARWRSIVIANTYISHHGPVIMQGPFAGMNYLESATEGALIPRLIGSYENELHPYFEKLIDSNLDCVIDIGCAEGYYAVGLARMIPSIKVYAYDIAKSARQACAELASRNDVTDRVIIGERFEPDGFEAFKGRNCLVMVDTEGAELDILQPDLSPELANMRIIVETHDMFTPGALNTLMERFGPTHDIERVDAKLKALELPEWFRDLAPLDHLLAIWEWRAGPTPWLIMEPKATAPA